MSGRAVAVASSGRAPRGPGRRRAPSRRRCTARSGRTTRPAPRRTRQPTGAATSERATAIEAAAGTSCASRTRGRPTRAPGGARLAPGTCVPVGARVRPTIDPGPSGTRVPLPRRRARAVMFCLRRPAIEPGNTWGVGHGTGNGRSTRGGSRRAIPDPDHEPNNWIIGQQAWWTVGTAAAHRIVFIPRTDRPPVSGGDLASGAAVRPSRPRALAAGRACDRRGDAAPIEVAPG